jgi:hypothetical protein
VTATKFLGVIINQTLTWSDHIKTVKQKVTKSIGIICRVRRNVPLSVLKSLYHSLIHPYFEYCCIIWAIHRSAALTSLYRCQKKAIRIITHSPWNCHTKPLFKKLMILPLYNINDLQVACFVYRCVNRLLPDYFCDMFKFNELIHPHNTRTCHNLHLFQHRLNLRRHTVNIFGPVLWNLIPSDLRSAPAIHLFKKEYKKYLLNIL